MDDISSLIGIAEIINQTGNVGIVLIVYFLFKIHNRLMILEQNFKHYVTNNDDNK